MFGEFSHSLAGSTSQGRAGLGLGDLATDKVFTDEALAGRAAITGGVQLSAVKTVFRALKNVFEPMLLEPAAVPTRRPAQETAYCFEVGEGELFAFAGLWDGWRDSNGQWVKTCSILTTTANAVTSAAHDRMPVILDPDSYDLWLDPGMQNVAAISELLKPFDARLMRSFAVSNRVNHVANDDAECSRRVELSETQNQLFS